MKKICFLVFFVLKTSDIFSQDSLKKGFQHIIAVSCDLTTNTSKQKEHFISNVSYRLPNYSAYYRIVLPGKTKSRAAFNCNFMYRAGDGYYYDGMLGGGKSYKGNFELIRAEIGYSQIENFRKNFFFALGINYGRLIYSKGTNLYESWSYNNGSKEESVSVNNVIYDGCLSWNLEIYYSFKLSQRSFILVGFRERLQTPDYIEARVNLTSSFFLAFNVR